MHLKGTWFKHAPLQMLDLARHLVAYITEDLSFDEHVFERRIAAKEFLAKVVLGGDGFQQWLATQKGQEALTHRS